MTSQSFSGYLATVVTESRNVKKKGKCPENIKKWQWHMLILYNNIR
jgi:hypothetical protein